MFKLPFDSITSNRVEDNGKLWREVVLSVDDMVTCACVYISEEQRGLRDILGMHVLLVIRGRGDGSHQELI